MVYGKNCAWASTVFSNGRTVKPASGAFVATTTTTGVISYTEGDAHKDAGALMDVLKVHG